MRLPLRTTYLFLIVSALVALVSFWITGPFNMRIDGHIYVSQVEQFNAGTLTLEPFDVALRAFKPLYGLWGAALVPPLSPLEALQLFNLILLFGFPFVSYFFLREFGFTERDAIWGTLWIVCGYPVLKYGLAIGTDLGGWFFGALTAACFLRALNTGSYRMLFAGSITGFVGGLMKEPGVVGLIFGGCMLLFLYRYLGSKEVVRRMIWFATPALFLEAVLMYVLFRLGFPSFFDWFSHVHTEENVREQYQFGKWIGVEVSAFHILLVFAFVGLIATLLRRSLPISFVRTKICALILATSPVLLWIFFISRILYIQFLFIVPLSLLGVIYLEKRVAQLRKPVMNMVLRSLPVVISLLLYVIAGTRSLFDVLRGG